MIYIYDNIYIIYMYNIYIYIIQGRELKKHETLSTTQRLFNRHFRKNKKLFN